MSSDYHGVIIEESLEDKSVLEEVKILETKIATVTPISIEGSARAFVGCPQSR